MRWFFFAVLLLIAACAPTDEEPVVETASEVNAGAVPWSVSRHIWPAKGGANDGHLDQDLDLIADVGAKLVRADVWWFAVEPEPGKILPEALESYSRAIDAAKKRGLEVLIILSNPPAWARARYERGNRSGFYDAFGRYATEVARMAGARVRYYQLWNEPNHIIDFVDGEGDLKLFARGRDGIRSGLVSAGAGDHRFKTIVNVLVDGHDSPIGPSWVTDVDFYMQRGAAIDVIGIDHYPGTWAIGDWGGNVLDRLGALGKRYGKSVAVLETGFSTTPCTMPWNTEEAQVRWIDEQIPRMHAKARDLQQEGVVVEMFNWFKLDDRDTRECMDPENHFGIVHTDRTKKPAFDALQRHLRPR